ncbi:2-dehydro-3-deoxygalactonokinase [Granulosicoccus antarcticus]|uniref:Putative 2-dehydro-3-deoxygalactonokinase DgoK1 n=1 Tax=Granulosicoccus antarcticus IMCC3135 TaxID=1192854 RepID=A0A2Z2NS62_9GAMM|nr:2-dehydro-3-deoxygalactonokinase [Granulosicoccus antarcticus]ASJ74322.1 putative 2-dehydro-3-deoxygalactonokinase DgoK1 [Granulosicoccus antarcticus IMCC3135]
MASSVERLSEPANPSIREQTPAWIGVDWGTSNLRVWVMNSDNHPLHALESSAGMGTLEPSQFEPTLLGLIEPYLDASRVLPVICCGMVGARQGWSDAGYLTTPVDQQSRAQAHFTQTNDKRISVHILPGVKQLSPADVMRGEETQIAGLLLQTPTFSGTVCLPGTHTKWVSIENSTINSFQTCMSGELFALLSKQSVLRHSVQSENWSDEAFDQAVASVIEKPETLASALFSLRAESLVNAVPDEVLRSRLSGLLIGAELASCRSLWSDKKVMIVGDAKLAGLYAQAMSTLDSQVNLVEGDAMTLSGLIANYQSQLELQR